MSKVYVLYEKKSNDEDRKLIGVITDFVVASAFISLDRIKDGIYRSWQSTEFNDPELLNRIAKENKK